MARDADVAPNVCQQHLLMTMEKRDCVKRRFDGEMKKKRVIKVGCAITDHETMPTLRASVFYGSPSRFPVPFFATSLHRFMQRTRNVRCNAP